LRYRLTGGAVLPCLPSHTRVEARLLRCRSSLQGVRVLDELPFTNNLERHNIMKLITAALVAFAGLSLCAAPIAFAQTTTADTGAIETKLKSMEDSWAAAQLQKDHGVSVVGGMLASDYAGVSSKGELRNKSEQLEHMKSDTDTYTDSKNDSMKVHVYAPNLATVCGTSTEKGKDKGGKEFSRSYAWVDTWMDRGGQWQCIASAVTATKM
jgi:hypothetical protein